MSRAVEGRANSSEEAFSPADDSYRHLIDSLGGLIWEFDARTMRYTFVNKGAERLLGYPATRWIDEPGFWLDHVHPEDRERAVKTRAEAIRDGRSHDSEYRMIAADGRDVWLRELVTVVVKDGVTVKLRGMQAERSQRIQALETLREKEEQYHRVFEATTDGLVVNDWDGNVVEVNPAFHRMHGYTHDEMVGIDPRKFVHPDYHEHLRSFFETVKDGHQFYTRAMDIRKDGTAFHIEVYGVPFLYNGKPHILGILRDITEQVEAYELLRLEEEQYRAVWEATTDGLAIAEMTMGTIVEVNPAFARMHGYTVEEMVGMHPTAFVHPDDYEVQAEFVEKARRGERAHAEGKDVRKDGTSFPIEVYAAPFMYNDQLHILAIMRDITERSRAEEQLRLKEEQYRSVWEATSDGLAIADLDANVVDVNPAWCRMHGYTREEMMKLHPVDYIHPDSLHLFADYYDKVRAGERFQTEAVDVRKDGTPFNVEVHEEPIMYNGKRHTLTILRDITERAQARELLEQRVEERTRELSTLLEVSANVASTLELKPLLSRILEQLKEVVSYSRASITVGDKPEVAWDKERLGEATVTSVSAWGDPDLQEPVPDHKPAFLGEVDEVGTNLQEGRTYIVHDVHEASVPLQQMVLHTLENNDPATIESLLKEEHSILFVPLAQKGITIGGMTLRHKKPGYYTERHARLAMGIASQAAIAIENGRLLVQAHEKAALEERQRLARELHDSVTQSLFSINLIARSVEVMLQREGTHSPETLEKMSDLRQLTQGALAEMRALIFELRPGALEEEGLLQAIRKHAAAVQGREQLQVEVIAVESQIPRLKPSAEEALYRIAQESLHNIVKHAKATRVEVCLVVVKDESDGGSLVLRVADDGIGFNTGEVPSGHMGLGTMSQRASALGGTCTIESTPGKGTVVVARIPLMEWQV